MIIKRTMKWIFLLALICLAVHATADDLSIVRTTKGDIRGVVKGNYRYFKGIPYAQSTAGSKRFTSPVPPNKWDGVLNATEYGPGCPQNCILPILTCPITEDEDCLSINVFTPVPLPKTPLPVFVFIHGGHFDQGLGGCELYDGSDWVTRDDVIFVTFNYRIGVLGYLAGVAGLEGNFGILDQQLALKWIQEEIGAFGGDPKRVTLAGQSAGGSSIQVHLIAPGSKGLFHQAIVMSAPLGLPMRPMGDARRIAQAVMSNMTCTDLACLKSASVEKVLAAQWQAAHEVTFGALLKPIEFFYPWTPTVDGKILPAQPLFEFWKGNYNKVPILIGTVTEEAYLFIYQASPTPISLKAYQIAVGLIMGTDFIEVYNKYPGSPNVTDYREQLGVMGTDYLFTCNHRYTYEHYNNTFPTWVYLFNHSLSFGQELWGPRFPYCVGHVCHASELPFVFNPPAMYSHYNVSTEEKKLAQDMSAYFINFVVRGDPNVGLETPLKWPPFVPRTGREELLIQPKMELIRNPTGEMCDFWDTIGYRKGW